MDFSIFRTKRLMAENYQHQKLAEQVSKLIKKYEASSQFYIRMGTPAITVGAIVGALAANAVQKWLDDGFHTHLKTEKALIHSARESNSIQEQDNIVMPNISNLLVQREKFLSQN
ncbi:MAG: hypothetical protein MK105_14900 [Crocinitomicaceae bacterium]|nr:hypothetical protein [Crocinitomicaceae bacterium]